MMRKWLLMLAVMSLTPQGTRALEIDPLVDIYGSLRPEVVFRSPEGGERVRRMADRYSRVGLKGRVEVPQSTIFGFYKYERRVSANDGEDDGAVRGDHNELRQVHVGIGNGLGTLTIGRHYGLYYDVIDDEIDRHRSHYSDAIVFGDLFVSNAVLYQSPSGPVQGGVLVEFNDADATGAPVDERIEFATSLADRGFSLHLGYVNSPAHDGLFGVAGSYGVDGWKAAGVYQRFKRSSAQTDKLWSGSIDLDVTPVNGVRLAFTRKLDGLDPDLDETVLTGGADHRFTDQFVMWVEYAKKSTKVAQAGDEAAVVMGLRLDF